MVDLPAQLLLKSFVLNTVSTVSIVLNTGKRGARVHLSPKSFIKIYHFQVYRVSTFLNMVSRGTGAFSLNNSKIGCPQQGA